VKKVIVGFVVGVVLATTGVGFAALNRANGRTLYSGAGIHCELWPSSYSGKEVLCVKQNGEGYGVGFSQSAVVVSMNGRKVFGRAQP